MVEYQDRVDAVFRALGDPTRLRMIERLSHGAQTVGELAKPLAMTLAGASKHVGVLEAAGLVTREKRGRERLCRLNPQAFDAAARWVEHYSQFWDARLDALEKAIREDGDD